MLSSMDTLCVMLWCGGTVIAILVSPMVLWPVALGALMLTVLADDCRG